MVAFHEAASTKGLGIYEGTQSIARVFLDEVIDDETPNGPVQCLPSGVFREDWADSVWKADEVPRNGGLSLHRYANATYRVCHALVGLLLSFEFFGGSGCGRGT